MKVGVNAALNAAGAFGWTSNRSMINGSEKTFLF